MKKVLVIEDNEELQTIYKEKLTEAGFEVSQAADGNQGIVIAKEQIPDVVILDIMLAPPANTHDDKLNGFDVLEQIKATPSLAKCKVLILTNLEQEEHSTIAQLADEYIVKANTSIEDVITKIKSYLN